MNISRTAIAILTVLGLTATPRVQAQYNFNLNYQTNTINGVSVNGSAVITCVLTVNPGDITHNSWMSGNGKWETAGNWSAGFTPTNNDVADLITNAGNNTVTIDATTVSSNSINGCLTISNLLVSAPGGMINILALNNSGTATPLHVLNNCSITNGGALSITNGALQLDGKAMALSDDGTVLLSSGQLSTTNSTSYIGNSGVGQMTVSNGTWQASAVGVGYNGGSGTLTIAGGTNWIRDDLVVASGVASGTVWLTGGQLFTTNSWTYIGYSGSGQMSVSNGTWQASVVWVGGYNRLTQPDAWPHQGKLTIAGGTNSIDNWMHLGCTVWPSNTLAIGYGELAVASGSLYVTNKYYDGTLEVEIGQVTLSGGLFVVDQLIVTNKDGRFNLLGGTLNCTGATISNGVMFADGDGSNAATYNMLGGMHSFDKGLEILNNASLTGCGTVTGKVTVDSGGTVLADCGVTLTFTGTVTNNGTVTAVAGTTINFSVLMVNNGTLVATNGSVNFFGGVVNHGTMVLPPNNWIDDTGKWETATNWSSGLAPSNLDPTDLITNAGNKTVTIDAITTNTPSTMTINTLTVSAPSGSTNMLALSNTGTLSTPFLIEGAVTVGGGGVITVTNSALEVDTTGGGPAGFDAVLVGVVGSGNTLAITNGAALYDTYGILGSNSTSSGNSVLVGGAGSVWSNRNNLYVGFSGAGNQLTITNGGQVVNRTGFFGIYSSNNIALVTGAGSVWKNSSVLIVGQNGAGNQLTIANGGQVVNGDYGALGYASLSSSNNVALVTDSGSIWSNQSDLYVGYHGGGNQLIITNRGQVVDVNGNLGGDISSTNNGALVTGAGSIWNNSGDLYVGDSGPSNQLTIANGGQVINGTGVLGGSFSGRNNVALVTGAGSIWSNRYDLLVGYYSSGNQLTVTNGGAVFANNLVLRKGVGSSGTLTLAGGTVNIALGLIVTNSGSAVVFNSGTLNSAGATVSNGITFADGDGIDVATYHLLGGTHSFANGLEILNNASLTGCGTVTGNVTVDSGGTVVIDCGGTLTFGGIVTNNGTMQAVNGSVLEAYGLVVNNGLIDITGGTTNFHSGFINNGIVCSQPATISTISSPADSGTTSGGGSQACGTSVTVTATASNCNRFVNWTEAGTNVSASASYTFTAFADRTLVANFTNITYTITTTNYPSAGGTVSGGGVVPCGSNVTVCATANPGYAFLTWSSGNKSNCYTFLPYGNTFLGAVYGPFQMTGLAVLSNNVRVSWIAPHGLTNLLLATKGGPGGGYSNSATNVLVAPPFVMPVGDPTIGVSTNYLDVGGATNKPARYYRVLLAP